MHPYITELKQEIARCKKAEEALTKKIHELAERLRAMDELRSSKRTDAKKECLLKEDQHLKLVVNDRFRLDKIVGKSPAMQEVYDFVIRASAADANIVIEGESGTGKELVALTIHKMSRRCKKPFLPVNCGAIPENLFESQFFGHRKGAFTGAYIDNPGLFDHGACGTIFLDEVGELSHNMQVKLLRAIEHKGYSPVGGTELKQSDVRIIAATNRSLDRMLKKGQMRKDFFYRINILSITLPALRSRKEDIPFVVEDFLQSHHGGVDASAIPAEIMAALCNYDWPGNVRELQNVLLRYLTIGRLDFNDLDSKPRPAESGNTAETGFSKETINLQTAVNNLEKAFILKALDQTKWNRSKAAAILGISRRALFRKTRKLDLK